MTLPKWNTVAQPATSSPLRQTTLGTWLQTDLTIHTHRIFINDMGTAELRRRETLCVR